MIFGYWVSYSTLRLQVRKRRIEVRLVVLGLHLERLAAGALVVIAVKVLALRICSQPFIEAVAAAPHLVRVSTRLGLARSTFTRSAIAASWHAGAAIWGTTSVSRAVRSSGIIAVGGHVGTGGVRVVVRHGVDGVLAGLWVWIRDVVRLCGDQKTEWSSDGYDLRIADILAGKVVSIYTMCLDIQGDAGVETRRTSPALTLPDSPCV